MAVHSDAPSPTRSFPFRWILLPAIGIAVVSAAAAILARRANGLPLSPMSEEWLRSNESTLGRQPEI